MHSCISFVSISNLSHPFQLCALILDRSQSLAYVVRVVRATDIEQFQETVNALTTNYEWN